MYYGFYRQENCVSFLMPLMLNIDGEFILNWLINVLLLNNHRIRVAIVYLFTPLHICIIFCILSKAECFDKYVVLADAVFLLCPDC